MIKFRSYMNGKELEWCFFPKFKNENGFVVYSFAIYLYPTFLEFHFGKKGNAFWLGNVVLYV
jgi:hypothetical protein